MKKQVVISMLAAIMIILSGIESFATESIEKTKAIVIEEDVQMCKEFDITNQELEAYLNSIDDIEKRELLKKYFYLPVDVELKETRGSKSILDDAKRIALLSNSDLKILVKKIENNIPNVINKQQNYYQKEMVIFNKKVEDTRGVSGTYTYTLSGNLSSNSGVAVWIESKVTWTVNGDEITYLAPKTTTGKTSYYKWLGGVTGTQSVSGNKGHVRKERSVIVSTQDQSDPRWTVWCEGKFGTYSSPDLSNGGYYVFP